MIYLVCFTISTFFGYFARFFNKKSSKIILFVGFLLTCILAGIRALDIGTDIDWYALPLFNASLEVGSIFELTQTSWLAPNNAYIYASNIEPLYLLLTFIVAKSGLSFNFLLFLIQLLIEIPLYIAVVKLSKKNNSYLGYIAVFFYFCCFSFNYSLNLMRQYIATSFVILSFIYFISNKYWKSLLVFVVAFLFHKSSLICLVIPILYIFFNSKFFSRFSDGLKFGITFGLFFISLVCVLFGTKFLYEILLQMNNRYASYLSGNITFSLNQILIRAPLIVGYLVSYKNLIKMSSKYYFFFLFLLLFDLTVSQLSSLQNAYRLSYYFMSFNILAVFFFFAYNKSQYIKLYLLVFVIYCVVYWLYFFYFGNSGETLPFKFFWE